MKKTLLFLVPVLLLASSHLFADHHKTAIFNGKDLEGWKVPENNIWYLVEDSILKIRSGPEQKGSILWTEKEFENFVVELEFRFGEGVVDSGVHVRNEDQIQIGISGSLKRDMTASPYIPGKGYPVEAEGVKDLLKEKDWNQMKIEVKGMTYTSETGKAKGPIGLQLHGKRDMGIDYRNMTVEELK